MIAKMREVKTYLGGLSHKLFYELYYKTFQKNLYQASRDYKYTDEHVKFVHILEAVNYARVALLPVVYFEFGCHSARTFSAAVRAANYLRVPDAQFFAFDSFQGLPQVDPSQDGYFEEGTFHTSKQDFFQKVKKKSGLSLSDEQVIEGFYSESLTQELQKKLPKASIIHVDVDLYSSTKEVLNFIAPLLMVGTVILFDDWYAFAPGANQGEAKALYEFLDENPNFSFQEWKNYSTFGKSFFVVSV